VGRAGRAPCLLALSIALAASVSLALAATPALATPVVNPVIDRALIDEYAAVTTGTMGLEYSSLETVRAHNLVVSFSLAGTPGNTEANPQNSLALLAQVAAKL
jgi:opacity protein-like surface antigen